MEDPIGYGRELIPRTRELVAQRLQQRAAQKQAARFIHCLKRKWLRMRSHFFVEGSIRSRRLQGLFQVGQQIVDMLDADGQAHGIFRHARLLQFGGRQLTVRSGSRMRGQ